MCQKWKVKLLFRGAYRLSGTGIVEKKSQNHRGWQSGGESSQETVQIEFEVDLTDTNGAERVENLVSGSGAVIGHSRKRLSGSRADSGLNRPLTPNIKDNRSLLTFRRFTTYPHSAFY